MAKELKVPVCVVTVTEAWSAFELARMARFGGILSLNMKKWWPLQQKTFLKALRN
jgi:hypothetical protein